MEKLQKHLDALKKRHAELDMMITEELARPMPDDMKIQEYKKQKLAIKQEIEEVEKELA